MKKPVLYFRDFLSRLTELGGDISKIYFFSHHLANDYRILEIKGVTLVCDRIRRSTGTSDKYPARFGWGKTPRDSSGIRDNFVVVRIDEKIIGKGLKRETVVSVRIARENDY